ncbi:ATP-dependent zinc metalloprotease FtsH [Rhodobacteraceae bacterium THAF1]|uniref:AAA family ATPase n=1 Tax=Palleronia sp. THAF1 TaxID=2587842 RepID=UPI000F3DBC04|nr:AAA family ATPase [Palleronia sp. THAF1]QFU07200.1 ATP-dependent zinc metalloprotease FtsH [Palleronia sp. THAF1]VDC20612.1 ATP-dependent zinc metalloprotease FtsH [Rhodobacteraceae bacterium THAF1]
MTEPIDHLDLTTQAIRDLVAQSTGNETGNGLKLDAWATDLYSEGRFPPEVEQPKTRGLVAAFARPELRTSRAEDLTPTQIAELIEGGDDPYADSSDEAALPLIPDQTHRLAVLARAAKCLVSLDARVALSAPVGILLFEETDNTVAGRLKLILQTCLLPRLISLNPDLHLLDPEAVANIDHPTADGRKKPLPATILPDLAAGHSCVLIGEVGHLTAEAQMFVRARISLPPLDADMVVAIFRGSHSRTNAVAEDAIRSRLPSNHDLSRLPDLALAAAFSAPSTLKCADRLAELATLLSETGSTRRVTLDDLKGLPAETRAPIDAVISDVRSWRDGDVRWSDIPQSFLLHGAPGCGKTQLARGVAGELGVPIVECSYADWQSQGSGHLGSLLASMRSSFDAAERQAPCILFVDEIDSFPSRRDDGQHGSSYNAKSVNGLLAQMNRLKTMEGVVFIAATNFPDKVDPALLRSGRMDLKIEILPPDLNGLAKILKYYLDDTHIPDTVIASLSARLLGKTGADLEAVVKRARSLARASREKLSGTHLESAVENITPVEDLNFLERVSVHEVGHAIVGRAVGLPPRRICIAMDGGFTVNREPNIVTVESARRRLTVLMGGRAAEEVIYGEVSNGSGGGAQSDLARATQLAARIVAQWGFDGTLFRVPDAAIDTVDRLHPQLREKIEGELQMAGQRAIELLRDRRTELEELAKEVLEKREINFYGDAEAWDRSFARQRTDNADPLSEPSLEKRRDTHCSH